MTLSADQPATLLVRRCVPAGREHEHGAATRSSIDLSLPARDHLGLHALRPELRPFGGAGREARQTLL